MLVKKTGNGKIYPKVEDGNEFCEEKEN